MGQLEEFTDMTGNMSQEDINQENISNIIDELNRNSDQLDSLNNVLSVIAYGSLTYNWDGSGDPASPTSDVLVAPETSDANFIGFVYMARSDDEGLYFNLPYYEVDVNSNGDSVIGKRFDINNNSSTGQLEITIQFLLPGSPTNFTFYYFLVQQPANTALT